ncbi:MAG: zinc ribbon domain-containing protein [Actinobacteria bacterium]|nr:zinc ribbon domain-containing protein [Actinomycetota bacterium]
MDFLKYFENIMDFFRNPAWKYMIYGIVFILIIIWLSFVYWTYRDARLRNTSALFWALIVFLFNYLGLIIYLILRPPEYIEDILERDLEIKRMEMLLSSAILRCPTCGKEIKEDYIICPNCRKKLKKLCVQCERPLNLDWKVCPYCKAEQ